MAVQVVTVHKHEPLNVCWTSQSRCDWFDRRAINEAVCISGKTCLSIQQLHRMQCTVSVFKVNEAVVLHFFHSLHFAILLKLLTQLVLSHVGLQISYIEYFHLDNNNSHSDEERYSSNISNATWGQI